MREKEKEKVLGTIYSNADLKKLILPLVMEQLLAILVGMLDTVMISGVGEAAVSGVSLVDNINILVIQVFSALATGGAVVAGHALGRHNEAEAGRSAWQMVLFLLYASAATTVVLIGAHKPQGNLRTGGSGGYGQCSYLSDYYGSFHLSVGALQWLCCAFPGYGKFQNYNVHITVDESAESDWECNAYFWV